MNNEVAKAISFKNTHTQNLYLHWKFKESFAKQIYETYVLVFKNSYIQSHKVTAIDFVILYETDSNLQIGALKLTFKKKLYQYQ